MVERYRVTVAGRLLLFGPHTVARYQERVKPSLSFEQVRVELARVLPLGEWARRAPAWTSSRDDATAWLLLGDGIAFPMRGNVIVSCLTRSEVGAEVRVVQARERRERAAQKRAPGAREKHGKVARRDRAERRRMRADGAW